MDDVINRKDAIGAILSVEPIAELSDGDAVIRVSAANYVLGNLPSAQPEPQWRPCSEPPEEDGVYIVYAPGYSGGSSSAKECHNGVMFSKYKNGKWSIEHGYYSRPNCVKAWKPLDEPCRGEGEPK